MSIISVRLKALRKDAHMRQQDVADKIHIDRSTYASYEIGRTTPPQDKIVLLSELYEVSTDYILGTELEKSGDLKDQLDYMVRLLHESETRYNGKTINASDKRMVSDMITSYRTILNNMTKE